MTRKLLMTAIVAAIALAAIGIGIEDAGARNLHGRDVRGRIVHSRAVHNKIVRHRDFVGIRGFLGDGLGYGGFIGYTDSGAAAVAPPIPDVPLPAPAVITADPPPCHETTTEGVVIMRGTSCSRGAP